MERKALAALLPQKPTISRINPAALVITVIAPPKWGKTRFFTSNPNSVLLAFEAGHGFQLGNKMIIDCWDAPTKREYEAWTDDNGDKHMTFMQAIEVLEEFKKFDFVTIDTANMAGKMCADYYCQQGRVEHISDLGDWGKGFDKGQNNPFRIAMMRLLKTGRGLGFVCHTKLEIAKFTRGEKARKEMLLPGGLKYFVESQSDIIMHGELGKRQPGNKLRDRIMVCEGDDDVLAGNRSNAMLPERYIVSRQNPWAQFQKFFTDPKATEIAEKHFRKMNRVE